MDDYFSPQPHRSAARSSTIPTMIPRELPASPDRQSVHYPGFDVHPDKLIPLFSALSAADSSELYSEIKRDKEGCKENLAPRRKAKKAVTAPDGSELTIAGLLSPAGKQREVERIGKSRSTPATPKNVKVGEQQTVTPMPRRHGPALLRDLDSPSRVVPNITQKERRERRRMLEDEIDEIEGDEDVVDQMLQ